MSDASPRPLEIKLLATVFFATGALAVAVDWPGFELIHIENGGWTFNVTGPLVELGALNIGVAIGVLRLSPSCLGPFFLL